MDNSIIYQHLIGNERDLLPADGTPIQASGAAIYLCQKGRVNIQLDGHEYKLSERSLIVYFPYSTLEVKYRSADMEGLLLRIDIEGVQPMINKTTDIDSILDIRQNPQRNLTEEQYQLMLSYISLLRFHQQQAKVLADKQERRLWQLNNLQAENIKETLILQVIVCFNQGDNHLKSAIDRRDLIAKAFLNELNTHFRTEHEVTYYAEKQNLSVRYFSNVIKQLSGNTPSQWIANALLTDAKSLLLNSDQSIKEISETLHFPTQSYFGKWFKNHTGMSPLEYKRYENLAQSATKDEGKEKRR